MQTTVVLEGSDSWIILFTPVRFALDLCLRGPNHAAPNVIPIQQSSLPIHRTSPTSGHSSHRPSTKSVPRVSRSGPASRTPLQRACPLPLGRPLRCHLQQRHPSLDGLPWELEDKENRKRSSDSMRKHCEQWLKEALWHKPSSPVKRVGEPDNCPPSPHDDAKDD